MDLFPPKEPLEVPPPLLHQLLPEPPFVVNGMYVQDDGDDQLRMQTLDKPLELRGEGVVIAASAEVVAIEGVAALAKVMGVCLREMEDNVAIDGAFKSSLLKLLLLPSLW